MRRHNGLAQTGPGHPSYARVHPFPFPTSSLRHGSADATVGDTVAKIEGRAEITAGDFRRTYDNRPSCRRIARYGASMSEQLRSSSWASSSRFFSRWSTSARRSPKRSASASPSATRKSASGSSRFPRFRRTAPSSGEQRAISSCCASQRPPMLSSEFEEEHPHRQISVEKLRSVADRLAYGGPRQGRRAGIPAPQRQGEARRRRFHRRQLPGRRSSRPATPRSRATSRRTRTTSRSRRSARSATS